MLLSTITLKNTDIFFISICEVTMVTHGNNDTLMMLFMLLEILDFQSLWQWDMVSPCGGRADGM